MKQNIKDLQKLINSTRTINDDNISYIEHKREEVQNMREQQMKNIDIGFAEVIKGLEAKRDLLKEEFQTKYDAESSRFEEKMGTLEVYSGDIANIESIYDDLSKFIERSSDAKMLTKITEVSEFIQKSIENLEQIGKAKGFDKADT